MLEVKLEFCSYSSYGVDMIVEIARLTESSIDNCDRRRSGDRLNGQRVNKMLDRVDQL